MHLRMHFLQVVLHQGQLCYVLTSAIRCIANGMLAKSFSIICVVIETNVVKPWLKLLM